MYFKTFFLTLGLLAALSTNALAKGNLQGAWARVAPGPGGDPVKEVMLFSGDYFSWTAFSENTGAFIETRGGIFSMENDQLVLKFEFYSSDTTKVGLSEHWTWSSDANGLTLSGEGIKKEGWKSLEDARQTDLAGVWLMGGRVRDGETTRREVNVPRKTMKILTGTRFQWIAYNTETRQFLGTGGGSYSAADGKYSEKLEFFSRDNNRVGMQLDFSFDASSGDWHHTGKSSAGEPMHEIWVRRMQ
jgi:hypothetical protein